MTQPNEHWALSHKMPGWAVCFDEADDDNFMHKMLKNEHGEWERRSMLTNEEIVMMQDLVDPTLDPFRELALRVLHERMPEARRAYCTKPARLTWQERVTAGVALPDGGRPK